MVYTDSVKFIPGEILEVVFPIDAHVNKFNNIEGIYQMRAIFQKIPSNIVNFKMEPPDSDNEVQYAYYTKMTDIRENISLNTDDRVNNYLNFLNRFPNGPYSPDVFDFTLIAHLMSEKNNKAEDIVSKYFQYNYNSYTSSFIIDHYFTYLTKYAGYTQNDALHKIDSLSLIYNGSESARIIKNFIKDNSKQ